MSAAAKVFDHVSNAVEAGGRPHEDLYECLVRTIENVDRHEFKALENEWKPNGRFMRVC